MFKGEIKEKIVSGLGCSYSESMRLDSSLFFFLEVEAGHVLRMFLI